MKRALKLFYPVAVLAILFTTAGCTDRSAVIDQNTTIENRSWNYSNKLLFNVKIEDEKIPYNLYMNLRVTDDYRYSNLFVIITQTGADKRHIIKRYELTLANKQGEWLGKGSGGLYSYQLPFLTNYKFATKGNYQFYIEQNMRDNPLREVSDVGLRVEKTP
jgi:gliding motility-associated lipoprotein GldH